MKTKELAARYGFDRTAFEDWLQSTEYNYSFGFTSMVIDDSENAEEIVRQFQALAAKKQRAKVEVDAAAAEERRRTEDAQARRNSVLVIPGASFEGRSITSYGDYVAEDSVMEVDRGADNIFRRVNNAGQALVSVR